MNTPDFRKFRFVRILLAIVLSVIQVCLYASPALLEEWNGRVFDQDDRQPIKGAIVLRVRGFSDPGSLVNNRTIIVPVMVSTAQDGRFQVPDPIDKAKLSRDELVPAAKKEQRWVYRPGFQILAETIDDVDIAMARIPTGLYARRIAYDKFLGIAGSRSLSNIDDLEIRDVIQKEKEFLAGPAETLDQEDKITALPEFSQFSRSRLTTTKGKLIPPPCECKHAAEVTHKSGDPGSKGAVPAGMSFSMTASTQLIQEPTKFPVADLKDDELIERLNFDPDQSIRRQASIALGRRKVVAAVPDLLRANAYDKYGGVAMQSACAVRCIGLPAIPLIDQVVKGGDVRTLRRIPFVLRKFPQAEIQPILIRLASSPDAEVRVQALSALAEDRSPATLPLFLQALVDEDKGVRRFVKSPLGDLTDADVPALKDGAAHPHPTVRRYAIMLLAEDFPMQAGETLRRAMSDSNIDVQRDAARFAYLVDSDNALKIAEKALSSNDKRLRRSVIRVLERRDIPTGGRLLMQTLDNENDPSLCRAALVALCQRDESDGLAYVKKYLKIKKDSGTYALVMSSLTRSHNPDAIPLVRPALKKDAPRYRIDAVRALGSIATPKALRLVVAHANDPHPDVRKAVFASLSHAGQAALDLVDNLLAHQDIYIRWRVARMLGNMSYHGKPISIEDNPLAFLVIKKLQKALEDPAPEVRFTAVSSYRVLKRIEGAPMVIPLLKDPDMGIQEEAEYCLMTLTGQDFGGDQSKWREWIQRQSFDTR
jgi:HEAT repeat protein